MSNSAVLVNGLPGLPSYTLTKNKVDILGVNSATLENFSASYFSVASNTYNKQEVDNAISGVLSSIDWKTSVTSFADIATTYPSPIEGWTVSVNDEDVIYRYDGATWNILANGTVPLATVSLDGKLSSADFSIIQSLPSTYLGLNATAVSANKWSNTILLDIDGDITCTAKSLDGTNNVTLTASVNDDSHNHTVLSYIGAAKATAINTGINVTGNIVATGDITAFSDIRIKKDIVVIDNALEKVKGLKGVTFSRKDIDAPRSTGLIAQDILKVLPEAVLTGEDGIHSVAYGNLVGLLVEAIKDLNTKIDNLTV